MDIPEHTQTSSYRYFEVRARNGIISFVKQNADAPLVPTPLEKIVLTNLPSPINAACALMND
jgi:hypothetical protein